MMRRMLSLAGMVHLGASTHGMPPASAAWAKSCIPLCMWRPQSVSTREPSSSASDTKMRSSERGCCCRRRTCQAGAEDHELCGQLAGVWPLFCEASVELVGAEKLVRCQAKARSALGCLWQFEREEREGSHTRESQATNGVDVYSLALYLLQLCAL